MRAARTLTAALAGGVLALTFAAPALAGTTDTPTDGTTADTSVTLTATGVGHGGTTRVDAHWAKQGRAQPGDTVTLQVNAFQKDASYPNGKVIIQHPNTLTFVSAGAGKCPTTAPKVTVCTEGTGHTIKSNVYTFTVSPKVEPGSTLAVTVTVKSRKLKPTQSTSPSPSQSSPADGGGGQPSTSPSASTAPSESTSPTGSSSPSASPSQSLVLTGGNGDNGSLPVTGTPLALIGGLGALVLAAGGALLFLARRRRTS